MTDESLFPPRCCRIAIPISLAREYLCVSLSQKFEEKSIEFTDPHRTYCSNSTCSKYIFHHLVQSYVGTCNQCFQRTCTLCKKPAHEGKCPDENEEVIQLGRREGWQRCFQCRNMIELGTGCNHITCRCGAEFCYVCRTKWQHCRCELWDENRLYDWARHLANRARGPGQAAPARPEEVRRMVRWLRERHECNHEEYWPRIECPHQCEECRDQLPNFILQCGHCGLRACVTCRLNRL